jgi:hypothetical protein
MQQPPSPISERLRTIRRRVTVAVLATFVAAWLAVAAFGKGGGQSSATAASSGSSSQSAPSDDGYGGQDDNGYGQSYDGSGGQSSDSGADSAPAPLTSSQS